MRLTDTSDLWWKTAVIYCLDVETFMDWNNDGTGDFEGFAHRLDYLAELGVTCLWLMPFYPSPGLDNGYDVEDFYGVDARLGHLGDFVEVVRTAQDRGMRVIADLVINHTSDQHPWFLDARSSRDSPYRDFYIWRDEPPEDQPETMFPDEEEDVWEYDEGTGQYYLHNFYRHQPDLNIANERVREEIAKVIGFWMQLGISGFRVDSVPFFIEQDGIEEPHDFLRSVRSYLARRSGAALLLGEVNRSYEEKLKYFGGPEGGELNMQFDFVGNQQLFLALARQDARPLSTALKSRPEISTEAQWANFVRNHDELTLDKLTDDERQEVFAAFAPEERMQIFGRGIRRRLPSMLEGDADRIRMVYSLLFSLPGTPVLYYGEEIGMGENLEADGRWSVRTPMQWTDGTNGGFSSAGSDELVSPVVEGDFGPTHVNVVQQRHDEKSLLQFVQQLIKSYRVSAEIGWGQPSVLEQEHDAVLAHSLTGAEGQMVALHNLAEEPVTVALKIPGVDDSCRLVELLGDDDHQPNADGEIELQLGRYGYCWMRVLRPEDKRLS